MMMKMTTPWWIKDIANIIFPNTCHVCGRTLVEGESIMCLHCHMNLPRTGFHRSDFNTLHQRIGHKIPIEHAAAYFHYERDSDYASLIHSAKYRAMPHIARHIGAQYARELSAEHFFDSIDLIEPVPLSTLKLITRGYNQSEELAKGINRVTGIPIGHHLRARHHTSQTRKDARQRWDNVSRIYHAKADPATPAPAHILIVDDIITTGATMAACIQALHRLWPGSRVSILTIGATRLA